MLDIGVDFKIDGIKQEVNKSYPKKALLWICPHDVVFTKHDCVFLMKEYFSLCQNAGTIMGKVLPSFDNEQGYHVSSNWMKYLTVEDLEKVFQISHLNELAVGLTTFFKLSKNNLYSYIEEGAGTKDFFEKFKINEDKYLLPNDIPRVHAFFPELVNNDVVVTTVKENHSSVVVSPASTTADTSILSLPGNSTVAVRSLDFGPDESPAKTDSKFENVRFISMIFTFTFTYLTSFFLWIITEKTRDCVAHRSRLQENQIYKGIMLFFWFIFIPVINETFKNYH